MLRRIIIILSISAGHGIEMEERENCTKVGEGEGRSKIRFRSKSKFSSLSGYYNFQAKMIQQLGPDIKTDLESPNIRMFEHLEQKMKYGSG